MLTFILWVCLLSFLFVLGFFFVVVFFFGGVLIFFYLLFLLIVVLLIFTFVFLLLCFVVVVVVLLFFFLFFFLGGNLQKPILMWCVPSSQLRLRRLINRIISVQVFVMTLCVLFLICRGFILMCFVPSY